MFRRNRIHPQGSEAYSSHMKRIALLLFLLPSCASACLWVHGTTLDGEARRASGFMVDRELRNAMQGRPLPLIDLRIPDDGDASAADKMETAAVEKVVNGDFLGAIADLEKLEQETLGKYSVAANLGTAYELAGDNEKALKWITAGIGRNADSHLGTEWLHEAILRAKLDAAKRPANAPMPHILNVPERMDKGTLIQAGGKDYSAEQVQKALHYQLHERLAFVKPKDPYVADLLYSYALIEANLGVVEGGLGLLRLSKEYGFPDEALMQLHEKRFESILLFAQIRWWSIVALCVLLFILFLYYAYRRKWFFLSGRAFRAHKEALAKAKAANP